MAKPMIACCDLGGTKMLVGLVSLEGELLASEKYLIGSRMQPQEVIADLDAAITRLQTQLGIEREAIIALGCSSTGVMNIDAGLIIQNYNMGWINVPFRDLLRQHFQMTVALEMDANGAALGENWKGAARGLDTFAFVIVGTGIGGGVMIDGKIMHGSHGRAGEIGHTVLVPHGPLCGCGKHGCLEALSSGLAIARKAAAAVMLGRETALQAVSEPMTAKHVTEAAINGDPIAREIIDEAGYYLGIGLANFITVFDPQAIVLGGGVGWGAFEQIAPAMRTSLQQHLNFWAARETPILPTGLGESACLLGAARSALNTISQDILSEAVK